MTDTNPLGRLSPAEIQLVEEHRRRQILASGWAMGVTAAVNALDDNPPDGTVPVETYLASLRWKIINLRGNPKV